MTIADRWCCKLLLIFTFRNVFLYNILHTSFASVSIRSDQNKKYSASVERYNRVLYVEGIANTKPQVLKNVTHQIYELYFSKYKIKEKPSWSASIYSSICLGPTYTNIDCSQIHGNWQKSQRSNAPLTLSNCTQARETKEYKWPHSGQEQQLSLWAYVMLLDTSATRRPQWASSLESTELMGLMFLDFFAPLSWLIKLIFKIISCCVQDSIGINKPLKLV